MAQDDLFQNEAFCNMSADKLRFLMEFAGQTPPGSSREMLPFLMNFVNRARGQGISFSTEETDFVIEHLKQSMSPEERQRADMLVRMMRNRKK